MVVATPFLALLSRLRITFDRLRHDGSIRSRSHSSLSVKSVLFVMKRLVRVVFI